MDTSGAMIIDIFARQFICFPLLIFWRPQTMLIRKLGHLSLLNLLIKEWVRLQELPSPITRKVHV